MTGQPTLKTRRLILRPHTMADAPAIAKHLESGEVAATMVSVPNPYGLKDAETWLNSLPTRRENGDVMFAITFQDTREFIGNIGLNSIDIDSARAEIGYWIAKSYWGQGYGTEAAAAVIDYGFTVMELNRIYATHFRNNPASGCIMQKVGMTYEGRLRQHFIRNGEYIDFELYAILRSEYES